MPPRLTDEQLKEGLLNEIVPREKDKVRDIEEAEARFCAEKPPANIFSMSTYYGSHSELKMEIPFHRAIVEWYIGAVELYFGARGDYTITEDEPVHFINFKTSYVGWCKAHKISPEQDQTWNALYRALKAAGIEGFPTLSDFMLQGSTAMAEIGHEH